MTKAIKELYANIAQIIIVVLLLPIICLILVNVTGAQNTLLMLLDMAGEIQILDTMMDSVSLIMQMHDPALLGNPDIYLSHIAAIFETLDTSIFQIVALSLCVKLCNLVFDIFKGRGMHILSSLTGVILGYFVVAAYDIPIITCLFLFLLVFIVDMIFVQGVKLRISSFLLKYLAFCMKIIIKVLMTLFMTGFFAVLLAIWQGNVTSIGMIVFMLCMFAVPWFILAAVEKYIF